MMIGLSGDNAYNGLCVNSWNLQMRETIELQILFVVGGQSYIIYELRFRAI